MQNMVLATPILSDVATVTGSTSPATLPVTNLLTMSIGQVWRASDASAGYVVVDLASAKEINLVALLGHSGSSRSYARVRAATSEANLTAAPGYDSGLKAMRSHQSGYDAGWASGVTDEQAGALDTNHFMLWLGGNEQTYRWWRIDLVDPNASYLDVGRLYISNGFQPSFNMDYGIAEGWIDPSRKVRTVGGRIMPVERTKYRFSDLKLSFNSESEMFENVFEIERLRGATKDVLLIPDPEGVTHLQRRMLYGTMAGLQPIINTQFSIYEKSFRIEEIAQ